MIIALDELGKFNNQKIGILGGSFDPAHCGHLEIAKLVSSKYQLDAFIFLPARQNPLKKKSPSATNQQRLEMLSLLCESSGREDFYILDCELNCPQKSYTVETLEAINKVTNAEVYFTMGTDQLETKNPYNLVKWYQKDRLFELATLVFISRNNFKFDLILADDYTPDQFNMIKNNIISLDYAVSATEIRRAIQAGDEIGVDRLPKGISEYVSTNSLYQS